MLARDIIALEEKLTTEEEEAAEEEAEEAEEAQEALDAKRAWLAKAEKDIDALEVFYKEVCDQLADIARRNIGHVDWAPEISVDVGGRRCTKDIGTFEVDAERFRAQFKGNVVDLGTSCPRHLSFCDTLD